MYGDTVSEESVNIEKAKIVSVIENLVEKKPPKTSDAEMYVKHLIGRIETSDMIRASEIIEYLACAGYSIQDIVKVFYDIGVISSSEDWVRYREAVRRAMVSRCKE